MRHFNVQGDKYTQSTYYATSLQSSQRLTADEISRRSSKRDGNVAEDVNIPTMRCIGDDHIDSNKEATIETTDQQKGKRRKRKGQISRGEKLFTLYETCTLWRYIFGTKA